MRSYVISVSVGTGCYRHIQISKTATLYKLHKAIISAFDFEDDHAHAFFMDNKYWSDYAAFFSMKMHGDERLTKSYKLEKLGFLRATNSNMSLTSVTSGVFSARFCGSWMYRRIFPA